MDETSVDRSPGERLIAQSGTSRRVSLELTDAGDLGRLSDEELAGRARAGDPEPFEVLWRRHADAGRRVASRFTSASDPDDVVQEAYLRIFSSLGRGKGPDGPFRPYLYQTIRNIAITWSRQQTSSIDLLADRSDGTDLSESVLEGAITATAFRSLPARWQEVLWYTEVEGLEAGDIAPLLGLNPSAVSALSYRAREGLRRAWLQAHVSSTALPEECRWSAERMGEAHRGALSPKNRSRFDLHVGGCSRCMLTLDEVDEASQRLRLVIVPLLVGVPWATLEGAAGLPAVDAATGSLTSGSSRWNGRWSALRSGVRSGYRVSARALAVLVVLLLTILAAVVLAWGALRDTHAEGSGGVGRAASPVPARGDESSEAGSLDELSIAIDQGAVNDTPLLPSPDATRRSFPRGEPTESTTAAPVLTPPGQRPESSGESSGSTGESVLGLQGGKVPVQPGMPEEPKAPEDPDEPGTPVTDVRPVAPTLMGPPVETPLTIFPALSGVAAPESVVVISTVAGDELTNVRSDARGAWSAIVCTGAIGEHSVCSADGESLAVVARVLDEKTGLISEPSDALAWRFERPTVLLSAPSGGPLLSGDISVTLSGSAEQIVQVIIDGIPTGRYHLMPQSGDLVWRDVTPGLHTVGVRYVTVVDEGLKKVVTGFGPLRSSTVTVEQDSE